MFSGVEPSEFTSRPLTEEEREAERKLRKRNNGWFLYAFILGVATTFGVCGVIAAFII